MIFGYIYIHCVCVGGASQLVSGLIHPNYNCSNPAYPAELTT